MQIVPRDFFITVAIIVILCILFYLFEKERSIKFLLGSVVLAAVMVVICSLTGISPISGFHEDIDWRGIQIIPFKTIQDLTNSSLDLYVFENIVGNIIMFAPFGFLLPMLSAKMQKWYKVIGSGAVVSLCIESCQLFLVRSTDIDDVILNTLGVALGYVCFKFFKKILPHFMSSFYMKNKYDKWLIFSTIVVPFLVVILCGFYDRALFFR